MLSAAGIFFVGCGVSVTHGIETLLDPPERHVGDVRSLRIDLPEPSAPYRFVRLDLFNDKTWTFLGEVSFFRATDQDAEPAGSASPPEN